MNIWIGNLAGIGAILAWSTVAVLVTYCAGLPLFLFLGLSCIVTFLAFAVRWLVQGENLFKNLRVAPDALAVGVIGNGVFIGRNTLVYCKDGDIVIGDNANISFNCDIFSGNLVKLGANIQMAAYSFLNGGTHEFESTGTPVLKQGRSGRGIIVDDNVWLGANVKVLDGVRIGKDSIIGAGAVVTKDVPPFAIAAGVPARMIRRRDGGSADGDKEHCSVS